MPKKTPSARLKNDGLGNPKRGRSQGPRLRENDGIEALLEDYLLWMDVTGYSGRTRDTRTYQIQYFLEWSAGQGVTAPLDFTSNHLSSYQRLLYVAGTRGRRKLTIQTQKQHLISIQQFFRWLYRQRYIPSNPASDMDLPRTKKKLPRVALTMEQIESILTAPDLGDPLGLRDRSVMEVLFSTGIRRNELLNLCLDDLLQDTGTLMIRKGKGGKQRVVPIGQRAIEWAVEYIEKVRTQHECSLSENRLFLTEYGQPILPKYLSARIGRYVKAVTGAKNGSCHLFRHAAATMMLRNKADIRFIQEFLGHADIGVTSLYAHVEIQDLKKVHQETHPTG